ncbi:MAG: glycogen debranching protein, partial [Clostridiaceae bacterium]|nr:glycogen debranching protein [Clostridiaceae bacterium]
LQPKEGCFFYNMNYPYEHERGLSDTEDHYIPGIYEIDLAPCEEKAITVVASYGEPVDTLDGEYLISQEILRQKELVKGLEKDKFRFWLTLAADKFIVGRKSTNAKTIIAGYPWFTDWGRDTMIALTGLTLATKRFNDARDILSTFAKFEKDGLIPNVFSDIGTEPAYNTVDAALWYFEAIYKYIKYTGDFDFVVKRLLPVLKNIINGYMNGTGFDIKMDEDGLITAGNEETQLTWMDAKAGNWVVTPRHGKAVEINALWYNALKIMNYILIRSGEKNDDYLKIAQKVKRSFVKLFWNENSNCLYDVVNDQGKDDKIRPNQILAVSLSFPVLSGEIAKSVVNTVYNELYTAFGLRSLSQKSAEYKGIYIGNQFSRDGAYHQGTVWTWPLGQFITAYARVYKEDGDLIQKLEDFFLPFEDHLKDSCIGIISEIFDGNEPLIPRGCFAQAWSVAEILRAYVEDYLPLKNNSKKTTGTKASVS